MSSQNYKSRFIRRRPLFSTPLPRAVEKPQMKWVVLPILWQAAKRTAMAIGFMVLLSFAFTIWTLASLEDKGGSGYAALPRDIVLVAPFADGLADQPQNAGFSAAFTPPAPGVYQIIEAIEAAKDDPRVKALVATMGDGSFALAHVEEIRKAVKNFRKSGKPAYIYAPSFGETGGGLGRYYLASAFGQIWMQPMGVISIPGVNAESPYLRGLLDDWGIKPQFFQRYEYKTAYESVNEKAMTPANREMLTDMVARLSTVLVKDIAADRGLKEAAIKAQIDKAVLTGDAALKARLIDRLDYEDVLEDKLVLDSTGKKREDLGDKDMPFVDIAAYSADVEKRRTGQKDGLLGRGKPKVALVYAAGVIQQSSQGAAPGPGSLMGEGTAAADVLVPAIEDAADDDEVTAIVLRIDSPGGSPTASESILRALDKAKQKGKRIIVSMGPTAASGGYWIAAKADRIFALPTTITGSIGVLGGKLDMSGLWSKLNVNWDAVRWGENSTIWSFNHSFSESETVQVNAMLDDVYNAFLARVAEGRKMPVENVALIAKGRVWTGTAAFQNGLVDELGGLPQALDFAAKEAGLKSREDMAVEVFPKPLSPFEKLQKLLGGQEDGMKALAAQSRILSWLSPLFGDLAIARAPQEYGVYAPLQVR